MNFNALIAATAALACIAAPAFADSFDDAWVAQARAKVEQKLTQAGIAPGSAPVDVRLRIDGDGRLESPQIIASTGSSALDSAVLGAIRHVDVGAVPPELSGRTLTFRLGVIPTETASLPPPTRR